MNDTSSRGPSRFFVRLIIFVIVLALLIPVGGYLALNMVNQEKITEFVQAKVQEKTGRELRISGNIRPQLSLSPSVTITDVALSNPKWATSPNLVSAESVAVSMDLLPLLSREVVINSISATGVTLALEKNKQGKTSWTLEPSAIAHAEEPAEPQAEGDKPEGFKTQIGPMTFKNVQLSYLDHAKDKPITMSVPSVTLDTQENIQVSADIAVDAHKGTLELSGGTLSELTEKPVTVKLSLSGPDDSRVNVKGKIRELQKEPELSLDVEAAADSLEAFSSLAGSALPGSPPFSVRTELTGTLQDIAMDNIQASIDDANISGRARVNLSGAVPTINATLAAPQYRMGEQESTQPVAAAGSTEAAAPPAPKDRIIPDIIFPAGPMSAVDADIEFTIGEVITPRTTLGTVMGNLMLKSGILQVDPLQFKIMEDRVKGRFAYNPNVSPPAMSASMSVSGQDFGKFLTEVGTTEKVSGGVFNGALTLKGQGGSLHAMLPSLNGTVEAVVEHMVLEDPKMQDATELANMLQGKNRSGDIKVNCALAKLDIDQGVGQPEYLVADTKHVRMYGEGSVHLPQESLSFVLYPQPKSAGFAELSFPVRIKGRLANPEIKPDRTQAAFSITKMFVDSKKLRGVEALLGKGKDPKAAGQDLSGLHPCLTPIENPEATATEPAPSLKDAVDVKREDVKEDFKAIEDDVRNIRDGLKGLLGR